MPLSLLHQRSERACCTRTFLNFKNVSQSQKASMLLSMGWWDPESSAPFEHVGQKTPKWLEAGHASLWNVVMRHTFPELGYHFFPPELLAHFCKGEDHELEARVGEGLARVRLRCPLVLLPIQLLRPTESGGHWSLLVFEGSQVRYYDTLLEPDKDCLLRAQCLTACSFGEDIKVVRTNFLSPELRRVH